MNGQEGRARRKVERLDTQKKDSSYCPVFFFNGIDGVYLHYSLWNDNSGGTYNLFFSFIFTQ